VPAPVERLSGLIRSPRLWPTDRASHSRRVTWMELFFDLIFAAAIAQIGTPLATDYTPAGLLRYSFLFVLVWLAWSGHTLFSTRFDTDDLVQRLLVLLQCFVAAVMAANAREPLDSVASAGFGAAYAGMRIILVAQYLRAGRVAETRTLTRRYAAGYAIAAALWIASALVPLPLRYVLWAVALTTDLAVPWFARKHSFRYPPDASHYPERFGLFTIILLGEFVADVMRGIESQETWTVSAASSAFGSMAFGFAIWWWYFDGARSAEVRHVKTRQQVARFHLWSYAHLPLFIGAGVAAVGFHHAIAVEPGTALAHAEGPILAVAVSLLMAALIAIDATRESGRVNTVAQVAVAGLAVSTGAFASHVPAVFVVLSLCACAVVQTVLSCGRAEE
jgi:low temperature requirement protein LtrA